jgi:hypothetical protein
VPPAQLRRLAGAERLGDDAGVVRNLENRRFDVDGVPLVADAKYAVFGDRILSQGLRAPLKPAWANPSSCANIAISQGAMCLFSTRYRMVLAVSSS